MANKTFSNLIHGYAFPPLIMAIVSGAASPEKHSISWNKQPKAIKVKLIEMKFRQENNIQIPVKCVVLSKRGIS